MIAKYLTLLTFLAPVWVSASAAAYFSAVPSDDRFPSNLSTSNVAGVTPLEQCYKHGFTKDGWTVEAVESGSYAFVCPSYTGSGSELDSRLTTSSFNVEEKGAWLRWNAKSVLPGFREAYDVVVAVAGKPEEVVIANIDAEDSQWNTHLVSLDDFVGEEIVVSFVCRSVNKYMLAVKEIFAGVFAAPEWKIINTGSRYASASDGAYASGTITNIGGDALNAEIFCKVGGDVTASEPIGEWFTGETREYKFELPVALNEATVYSIGIKDNEGNESVLASSDVFASHFKRTLFVDEGTGMWCNNCPDGILELDRLKEEYGDNLIEVSCHTRDPLAMDAYWSDLKFYAVPYMMLNRNRQTVGGSSKYFSAEYLSPTIAEISLPGIVVAEENAVAMEGGVRFAEDFDNADGRYKIGYTVVADIFSPESKDYYQQNNLTFPRGCQYYILPSLIPPTLARFENVVVDDTYSFSGIEGSLPARIDAMVEYASSFTIALPEICREAEEVRVAAYVIDTESGCIMNAASSVVAFPNSVECVVDTDSRKLTLKISPSGACLVQGIAEDEQVELIVTDPQGRIFDSFRSTPGQLAGRVFSYPSGLAIIMASANGHSATAKHFSPN